MAELVTASDCYVIGRSRVRASLGQLEMKNCLLHSVLNQISCQVDTNQEVSTLAKTGAALDALLYKIQSKIGLRQYAAKDKVLIRCRLPISVHCRGRRQAPLQSHTKSDQVNISLTLHKTT
jgi:hypothetical protein